MVIVIEPLSLFSFYWLTNKVCDNNFYLRPGEFHMVNKKHLNYTFKIIKCEELIKQCYMNI